MIAERFYLDFSPVLPDWETASKVLEPGRGVVIVEMMPPPEKIGSIYLPDEVRMTRLDGEEPLPGFEPSVGCVLASSVRAVQPGQLVLMKDGDGLCLEGVEIGSYKAKNEVRIIGRVVPEDMKPGYIEDLPWDETIVALYEMEESRIKTPLGRNYVVRREDAQDKTESGLWLPESAVTAPCLGQITHKGPSAMDYAVGDRVIYHVDAFIEIPGSDNLRIVHEDAIMVRALA